MERESKVMIRLDSSFVDTVLNQLTRGAKSTLNNVGWRTDPFDWTYTTTEFDRNKIVSIRRENKHKFKNHENMDDVGKANLQKIRATGEKKWATLSASTCKNGKAR